VVRSLIIAGWPTLIASYRPYAMLASVYMTQSRTKWRASFLSHQRY